MKRTFRILILSLLALSAAACARHTIIPDKKLAMIFHDAFLVNAYANNRVLKLDSLKIYEPIFESYGYTTDDVQYTIGNFSKRKSARLGDVVEEAIAMLEKEGEYYNREVSVLDTIDNVARRRFTRPILSDTLIRVRTLRDTSRLEFTFDVRPGEYVVGLKYLVDSLDQNQNNLRGAAWLERADSSRANFYTISLRRDREEEFSRRFIVDSTHRKLRIDFLSFNGKPRRPSVTIRGLKVERTPPTREAVESLYREQLDIRIFADEFFRGINPKDSL